MRLLTTRMTTNTATSSTSSATHVGTLQIKTNRNKILKLPAVANPDITQNLISVHDIARKYGASFFRPHTAEVVNTETIPSTVLATATTHNGLYYLNPPQSQAHAARTAPNHTTRRHKHPHHTRAPTHTKSAAHPRPQL